MSFSLMSMAIFAQNTEAVAKNPAKEATAKLKETYLLDAVQVAKMEAIQVQKQKNLDEIEKYKNTNSALYVRKRQAISTGTNGSVERILNKEQMKTFRMQQSAIRLARAKKTEEFRTSKASELQKQIILLELEEQF